MGIGFVVLSFQLKAGQLTITLGNKLGNGLIF